MVAADGSIRGSETVTIKVEPIADQIFLVTWQESDKTTVVESTTLLPVPHSRAVLRMPVPLASAARIAASLGVSILGRPIGLPLLVPFLAPWRAGVYSFLNNRAFELCKYAEHLKERPSGGSGCINRLLFEIEVAPRGIFGLPDLFDTLRPRLRSAHRSGADRLCPETG